MTHTVRPEWEKKFETSFGHMAPEMVPQDYVNDIKSFISRLLSDAERAERERIREGVMKIKVRADNPSVDGMADIYREIWEGTFRPKVLKALTNPDLTHKDI